MKIQKHILEILENCSIEGTSLTIHQQLDRKTYLELNNVLDAIGGSWNKKLRCHIFPKPVDSVISDIINFGEVIDEKKELQFYETPERIIDIMLVAASIKPTDMILEPSAGTGKIIKRIIDKKLVENNSNIVALEIAERKELIDFCAVNGVTYKQGDFLTATFYQIFDKIIMNPPFRNMQDIDHVKYAYKFLKPGGTLVAVMSEGTFFRENRKAVEFREWVNFIYDNTILDLEPGDFKESGTMVKTRILILRKES